MKVEKAERTTSRPAACVEEEICVMMKEMGGGGVGGGSGYLSCRGNRGYLPA